MKIAVLYVYCVCENYETPADRFLKSYLEFDPGEDHDLVVCVNDSMRRPGDYRMRFGPATPTMFFHDDTGWDIGAYIAFSKSALSGSYDAVLYCGGHCHFKRDGWLRRFAEAWELIGPGAYGSLASFEVRPHFCTTGFMTSPFLMRSFPTPVVTKEERYDFEHGTRSFHRMVSRLGLPVRLVTWDGIWTLPEWRKPANIYRRGDQSNCLTFTQHTEIFAAQNHWKRQEMADLADQIRDPELLQAGEMR